MWFVDHPICIYYLAIYFLFYYDRKSIYNFIYFSLSCDFRIYESWYWYWNTNYSSVSIQFWHISIQNLSMSISKLGQTWILKSIIDNDCTLFRLYRCTIAFRTKTLVQFPNCSRYSKSSYSNTKSIIVTVQPHCNGHFCRQASLLHLRPKFSISIRRFTITGTVRELHF